MQIQIKIDAPELVQAINSLATVLGANKSISSGTVGVSTSVNQEQPHQLQQAADPGHTQGGYAVPTAPQQPQSIQTQPAPQTPTPSTVPTSTQTYTLDQLAVAATQLVDAGRREELVALLNSFSVQALTALPKEQYGAFATKLREMGAKI